MKVRTGFVSNSSSSSFIVSFKQDRWDPHSLDLAKEQIKLLRKFGFRWTKQRYASRLQDGLTQWTRSRKAAARLGFSVACNQDEVIEFLVQHGIPFTAACHYGHESVFYAGKGQPIVTIRNPGREAETYSLESMLDMCVWGKETDPPLKRLLADLRKTAMQVNTEKDILGEP